MNVLKHMESIFVAAALLVCVGSYAGAENYKAQVRAEAVAAAGSENMAVVRVSGKRLSPATKLG